MVIGLVVAIRWSSWPAAWPSACGCGVGGARTTCRPARWPATPPPTSSWTGAPTPPGAASRGPGRPTAEPAAAAAEPAPVETPAAEPVEPAEPVPEPATYRSRLGKARGLLSGYLGSVRSKGKIDAATWDDLEEALIRADVGVGATDSLLDGPADPGQGRGHRRARRPGRCAQGRPGGDVVYGRCLAGHARGDAGRATARSNGAEGTAEADEAAATTGPPVDVWLFVGVNGVGKTTTVGKVASRMSASGTKVLLAAG